MNIGKIKSQIIKKIKGSPVLYHFAVNVHTRYDKLFKKNKVIRSAVLLTKHQKQKEYSLMSISDYCIKHNIPKNVIDPTTNRTVYIPEVYGGEPCKELEYTYPVVYWTKIQGLTAVSESSSVIIGNKLLNDKVLLEYFSKINIDNHMISNSGKTVRVTTDKNPRKIEKAIILTGEASNNYYHWIFDILGKVCLANLCDELDGIPLLIDECVTRHKTYLELLAIMNYKNRKIIILPSNRTFEVKKGYYISPYSWSSVYWKKPEPTGLLMKFAKDHMVIDEYKKTMTKKFNDDHQFYSDRIFLVRGKDKIKRLVNEDRLSSIAKRYGYELFDPETHTIHEQYNAFKYAKVIISDEGAALANLLWCANAPKVYIIIEKGKEDYQFSTMAHEAGVNCIYVEAESLGNRMHQLDEDLFNRIIKEI